MTTGNLSLPILRFGIFPSIAWRFSFYLLMLAPYFIYTAGKFDHNDFMYAVAPTFEGVLYEDIHYVQAPLSFYFLRALALLSPEGHLYTVLRLSSILTSYATLLVVAEFCFSSSKAKIVFLLLGVTNFYFASSSFEIGSYALPILFLACALAILFNAQPSMTSFFLAGLLVGLAGSTKLNHVLFAAPIFFFALLTSPARRGFNYGALAFSMGFIVGAAPLLLHFFFNPSSFIVHNLKFHSEFTNNARGLGLRGSLGSVASTLIEWLSQGGVFLLALSAFGAWRAARSGMSSSRNYLLVLALLLVSFVVAFSPAIGYKQYYVSTSLLAILCATLALENEAKRGGRSVVACLGLIALVLLVQQCMRVAPIFQSAIHAGTAIDEVSSINRRLAELLSGFDGQKCKRQIFSYSGAFAVDSGLKLSAFTEGGVFWARVDGHVPEKYLADSKNGINRKLLRPESLVRLDDDVNILMVGYYSGLPAAREHALLEAAQSRGFKHAATIPTRLSPKPLDVWVNPSCLNPKGG